jgi:hypothetical protein
MGLDMYLYKKTYVKNWEHMNEEHLHQITVLKNNEPTHIKPKRIIYITEEVGYWRKANAVHKWFVEHVQNGVDDCGEYEVELEQLKQLKQLCESVLSDSSVAHDVLPTRSGFFFGSTEYDEWYFNDIDHTLVVINEVLSEVVTSKDGTEHLPGDIYYHSSW